ncbi:hypothetical protein KUCAC02_031579 [Chaenocephalus aceratus]|nr:hypothetical protein KUCAC02_031579 [Chaenocephalus aceratus]
MLAVGEVGLQAVKGTLCDASCRRGGSPGSAGNPRGASRGCCGGPEDSERPGDISCVCRSGLIQVVLSEHNLNAVEGFEQVFNVSRIHLHGFNYRTFDNDVMLLKLSRQAVLNSYVQPAVLADPSDPSDPPSGSSCTVSGWGVTQIYSYTLSPVLRAVDVQMMDYCNITTGGGSATTCCAPAPPTAGRTPARYRSASRTL